MYTCTLPDVIHMYTTISMYTCTLPHPYMHTCTQQQHKFTLAYIHPCTHVHYLQHKILASSDLVSMSRGSRDSACANMHVHVYMQVREYFVSVSRGFRDSACADMHVYVIKHMCADMHVYVYVYMHVYVYM